MTLETLIAEFGKLPPAEQEAFRAYVTLRETSEPDPEIEQAWIAETRKRVQEFAEGKTTFSTWDDVEKRLADKHGLAD